MTDLRPYKMLKCYSDVFQELGKPQYQTFSVHDFYFTKNAIPDPSKINVIIRVDIDRGLHLAYPLAKYMKLQGISGSFYFLTNEKRYYNIWGTQVPKKIKELGYEIGLHYDHFYLQLVNGINGLAALKHDAEKLKFEADEEHLGAVFHGHTAMNDLGRTNWELLKGVDKQVLGLTYHDALPGPYSIKEDSWYPKCDYFITDYMGVKFEGGWRLDPTMPMKILSKAKAGDTIHLCIHNHNAFKFWQNWPITYNETIINKPSYIQFIKTKIIYSSRRNDIIRKIKNKFLCLAMISMDILVACLSFILRAFFFMKRDIKKHDRSISADEERKRIYDYPSQYWLGKLKEFNLNIREDASLLEVGAGFGQWLIAASNIVREVKGVEPNVEFSKHALQHISETAHSHKIELVNAKAENLPFSNTKFDYVLCLGVFMFTEQKKALTEMKRVLKPNGEIVITANGIGYFIMYIRDGLYYKCQIRLKYGLKGLINTLLKWTTGRSIPGLPTAVKEKEMSKMFKELNIDLMSAKPWLPHSDYNHTHCGFVTNYAFIGKATDL